jgi:hypothetical protein
MIRLELTDSPDERNDASIKLKKAAGIGVI